MGRIIGAHPTNPNVVFAHFDDARDSFPEPFPVALGRDMLEGAGVEVSVGSEFWAEITDGARSADEVNPRVLTEAELLGVE